MKKGFVLVFFIIVGICSNAQSPYTSVYGKFQVDEIRGCVPFSINIVSGTASCTPCNVYFDGVTSQSNVFTHTYNTPKTYKLIVVYPSSTIGSDSITIHAYPDIKPAFDIYSCAGSKVEINITDKNYDTYFIDFDNNGTIDKTINKGINQTAVHSYSAPGPYNISVQGQRFNSKNNCSANVQLDTVISSLPIAKINSLSPPTPTDASTLKLDFKPATHIQYKNEIAINNASSFQTLQTLYGVNSTTIPNLNLDNNYYCFRLSSYDPCANTNKYTQPICSHNFDVAFNNGVDQLTWQTVSTSVSGIQIKRDNQPLKTVGGTASTYLDTAIVCKTDYCYQLVSTYIGGATSTSLQKCGTAIKTTTPTSINNTSAVVNEPEVDLVWLQDPSFTAVSYTISRGPRGGSSSPIGTSTSTNFTDASYNNQPYCYQINYTDNCDNVSANGLAACPMILTGNLDASNHVTLDWSSYKGWNQGVKNFKLTRYYQPGQTPQTIHQGSDSTYIDSLSSSSNQVVYYVVTATANETGVSPSSSNVIKIVKNINLYHPTAFNPDSKEPRNKTFNVKGHFISSLKLEVFDRWGSLVFYSDKDEAWNGKKDGDPMPNGTYVWKVDGTDLAGNSFNSAGTIVLIRK